MDVLSAPFGQTTHGEPVPAEACAEYLHFYGLDFDPACIHRLYPLDFDGERLAVQWFMPPQPRSYALVCHGYYDHVGLYRHLISYLLARRVGVIAFDQLGHGLSSGARVRIDSFDRYVAATAAVLDDARARLNIPEAQPLHFLAQSMGGSVVMEYLHQIPQPVGEVVLLAPLVRPYGWWYNRWVFRLAQLTIEERRRTITRNAANDEFLNLQRHDPLQAQTLPVSWVQAMVDWFQRFDGYAPSDLAPKMIQGRADHTVSWRWSRRILGARYPGARWLYLGRAGHHLVNESDATRAQMWSWLDAHCDWAGRG